ncbi:MAG: ABC transporter substrate-binding protein, partial [Pseudomonadota bacterium]
ETDVQIEILPPSFMSDALASGTIDGFCVGEPWNSVAVSRGAGRIVTTKSRIWASSPEKVLGVRQSWADDNGDILAALIRALQEAAVWCEDNANRKALAVLLARPEYIGIEARTIERALNGDAHFSANSGGATFPWKSHALWLYTQMVRWGQVQHTGEAVELAKATYRPDIYRAALEATETAVPAANSKVEGALTIPTVVGAGRSMLEIGPDGFFDGLIFDPDDIDGYIARQSQSPLPKNYTTV